MSRGFIDSGKRPFRAPHHTITKAAMIGGGNNPYPGEISMAHNGVLFLDEFGEFDPAITELLRQPIEDGFIGLHRAKYNVDFPCRIMLVAAANPCKCGYYGDEDHLCSCTANQRSSYMSRFSGPMLDRIDIQVMVRPLGDEVLAQEADGMSTAEMKKLVEGAVEIQRKRYDGTGILFNGRLGEEELKVYCSLGVDEERFMKQAYRSLGLSMRSYSKIIKIARTIADLAGEEKISCRHLAEAIQYRELEGFSRK